MGKYITACFLIIVISTKAHNVDESIGLHYNTSWHMELIRLNEKADDDEDSKTFTNKLDTISIINNGLKPGYKFMFEIGPQRGIGERYKADRLKLDIINGFQINPFFSLGLGIGARYYSAQQALLVPIFLNIRTNFTNKPLSPYVAVGAGYSIVASNDFKDVGLLLNPSAGVSIRISDTSAMNVGLGCELQNLRNVQLDIYHRWNKTVQTSAITLNVGFSF